MQPMTTPDRQAGVRQFLQASLNAIVRAEREGRVPARFSGTGKEIWDTFKNELTPADLARRSSSGRGSRLARPGAWPGDCILRIPSPACSAMNCRVKTS